MVGGGGRETFWGWQQTSMEGADCPGHRVAAGSSPSPTEHHTKGPLFLALRIYPWPPGCSALSHPGLPAWPKPTQRPLCPSEPAWPRETRPQGARAQRVLGGFAVWQGHIQATVRRGLGRHGEGFGADGLGRESASSFPPFSPCNLRPVWACFLIRAMETVIPGPGSWVAEGSVSVRPGTSTRRRAGGRSVRGFG